MISVVLAEDHAIVRSGIRLLLEKAGDIVILGEAEDGQQATVLVEALVPDVIIMDIMMPRLNGTQAAEKIRQSKSRTRVLLLSMYSDPALVYQAIKSGVRGYILKSSVSEELLWAVRGVARGEVCLSKQISEIAQENQINARNDGVVADPVSLLSPREKEVLKLIADEYSSGEIAEMLYISERTVERHRANLMEKLQVHNLASLVRMAIKYGLVSLDK